MYEWEHNCAFKGCWAYCLRSLGYAWFEILGGYEVKDHFMVTLGVCIYPFCYSAALKSLAYDMHVKPQTTSTSSQRYYIYLLELE